MVKLTSQNFSWFIDKNAQTQASWISLQPTDKGKRNSLLQNTAFMVPSLKPTNQSEGVIVSGPERDNFRWDLKTSDYSIMRVASYPLLPGWHSPAETKGWPCSSLLSSVMVLEVRKLRSSFKKLVSSELTIWCCSDLILFYLWIFWPLQLPPLTKSYHFSLSQLGFYYNNVPQSTSG